MFRMLEMSAVPLVTGSCTWLWGLAQRARVWMWPSNVVVAV